MQAITTRYRGPTNFRGAKIVAECDRGRCEIPCPGMAGEEQHREAALNLCAKFCAEDGYPRGENPWERRFVSGNMKDGNWAHVFVSNARVEAEEETEDSSEARMIRLVDVMMQIVCGNISTGKARELLRGEKYPAAVVAKILAPIAALRKAGNRMIKQCKP